MKRSGDMIKASSDEREIRALVPYRESPPSSFPANDDPDFDDEQVLGLRDYWGMVCQRLWLVLTITFLTTALALVYVARQVDVYEAEARIQVNLENNAALGSSKNGSVVINNPGDDPSYFNTQLLLLKSPAFLRRVAKTLDMEPAPNAFVWDSSRRESAWSNIMRMAGLAGDRSQSEGVANKPLRVRSIAPLSADGDMAEAERLAKHVSAIRNGLDVKLTETSRLININFSHSDPNSAARAANVVADTFVQANWERRAASTSSTSDFLQKRIAELQSKIGENERRLIEYARDHQIFPLDSGRDIESDRLAALDRGLLEAENLRKAAEAEYQGALAPGAAAAIVEGNNNAQLSAIDARLADARQRRAVMLLEVGENWPEVKELNKQISDLEDQLKQTSERAIGVVLTNLETRYRQSLAREQSLRKAFEQQHNSAMTQNAAAIDYRMIQQETTTYRGLLDSLLQRSKENEIVLAATPNNVQVTDYATLPAVPVGPKRARLVALAFAFSLAFAVGLVVLLGSLEDSVSVDSVDKVERMFGLSALAVIPIASRRRRQLREVLKLKSHGGPGLLLGEQTPTPNPEPGKKSPKKSVRNARGHVGLLIYEEGSSSLSESYKKLRTLVMHSNGNSAPATLLVTSSLPGEGKTTVVINTGFVISQTGAKVLLIDGDLRHPTIHEVLGIENAQGLSTILSGDVTEAEILSMIEQYDGSNLYVLPAGPATDNAAELLASESMRRLVHTLRSTFSHIIIDSPPISFFTDAVLISSLVDGVLMIVRGPKSPRQVARYSVQSLDGVGAPILGVVLNAVNVRSNDYSYYRNYYR
ncbi:MAG: polysaccharide biosynthesis tyrosine autokinase [Pyrinomonadaceae bacterium]|nr:polysaccharide biosynthesis tyrosine autokinase [Pyrinomonadaceae bacterium]